MPVQRTPTGPSLPRRAVVLVVAAIGVGALTQLGFSWLDHRQSIEPETLVRYSIVGTLLLYLVVGTLVATQVTSRFRLRWLDGSRARAVATGVVVGGGSSVALLALVSTAAGRLSPDPRIALMVSEGDPAHILAAVLITCLAAPLVEEVLFRGVLLESLRARLGRRRAIWLSALGFAAWHLNPAALRYYALMGALLGLLYVRRGLVASMSAHAAFNGVLTGAAVFLALSPGTLVTDGQVSLHSPRGWQSVHVAANPAIDVSLHGPSAAQFVVLHIDGPVPIDAEQVLARIDAAATGMASFGATLDVASAREIALPAGRAVQADLSAQGHRGELVLIPERTRLYEVVFASGGSARATADFTKMLDSLRLS